MDRKKGNTRKGASTVKSASKESPFQIEFLMSVPITNIENQM